MGTTRRLPKKSEIREHWAAWLAEIGKFDSIEEATEADYCFACGFEFTTQRAHILAHCHGGSDGVENLHLLCRGCHLDSEHLSGEAYFEWLKKRAVYDCGAGALLRGGFTRLVGR